MAPGIFGRSISGFPKPSYGEVTYGEVIRDLRQLAECMAMGKPVIATAYSGNLDFMTPENSLLVDFERVPITMDLPYYRKGCLWADPNLSQAAKWMRWVYEYPTEARMLGAQARVAATRLLSLEAAGERMAGRLRELRQQASAKTRRDAA